jgi:DoxX-like family
MENPVWKTRLGWAFTGLGVFGLVASAAGKLSHGKDVVEGFAKFGIPEHLISVIGSIELAVAVLCAIPQTAVIGAILASAYFGGAVMTHLRMADPLVAPILVSVIIWFGVWFREPRLRALTPLVTKS